MLEPHDESRDTDFSARQGDPADGAGPGTPQELLPDGPPRLWPTLLVLFTVAPAALMFSVLVLVVALVAGGDMQGLTDQDAAQERIAELLTTPIGLLVALLPGQMVFFGWAFIPAWFSRHRLRRRVGLRRSRVSPVLWPVLLLALPVVQTAGGLLITACGFSEPSEAVQQLTELFTQSAPAQFALTLVLFSVVPGFVEEFLFRGYVLSRLLQRWHPAAGILLVGLVFAIVHGDVMHALGVFPLGLWFGFIAWRCGSIWPAILSHIVNNVYGITIARLAGDEASSLDWSWEAGDVVLISVSGVAFVASLWILCRTHPDHPDEVPATFS